MSVKKRIKNAIIDFNVWYQKKWLEKYEDKKIDKKKHIWENIELSEEEISAIRKIYGPDVDVRWHRYFASFTGNVDPKYLPEKLYSAKLEWIINPYRLCKELEDKALLSTLFGKVEGLRIPKTIVCKTYGNMVDTEGNLLTEAQSFELIEDYLQKDGKAILKPTRDTSSGQNVEIITVDDYLERIKKHHDDFIVQEVVVNQQDIKCLNPSSLNTFRVMTYICNSQFNVAPILLRMGVGDHVVDNAHAGGIFVGVENDGRLLPEAYSEYGDRYRTHPYTKIVFNGYRIDGMEKIINVSIRCHQQLPQLGMISWDFTLDQTGTPVLVEANLFGQSVWLPQIAHGKSIFGDNTIAMLRKIAD